MVTGRVICVGLKQMGKCGLGKNVVPHGGVDLAGIARDGGCIGVLFVKGHDASVRVGLNDPEFGGVLFGHGNGGNGHFRVFGQVEINHAGNVHAVDVIAAEDRHHMRIGLLDKVDILQDGVGGALVPGFILRTHLCRHGDYEVAFQQPAELPPLTQMLEQRLAAELREHIDGVDSGVDEIAEDEINDPVFAAKGNRRLRPLLRKGKEPRPLASGEYDSQHSDVPGSFRGEDWFKFSALLLWHEWLQGP